jgi:hypothetical protein
MASAPTPEGTSQDAQITAVTAAAPYKGCTYTTKTRQRCRIQLRVLGKMLCLGSFKPAEAEPGARLYDALQLLLRGPDAETNFEWSQYTQDSLAAAAAFLQSNNVDVREAMATARQGVYSGKLLGVTSHGGSSWQVQVQNTYEKGSQRIRVYWAGLESAEAAAHLADCAFLAIHGLSCTTNFPASLCSPAELVQAGSHALRKGVEVAQVEANLAAVEQV